MFELYAAEVRFRHDTTRRGRDLRLIAQRAERSVPGPVRRVVTVPRRSPRAAWPRPIAVHAV